MSAAVVEAAPVHAVTVAPGVTIDSTMSPETRFAVVAKAHGVEVTKPDTPPQFHTEHTAVRLAQGDASQAVDRKMVDALGKAFGTLDPKQRVEHRAAYEADLRALYDGQRSPGNLSTALDKLERDTRVTGALNKALSENKSPVEIKAILDGALGPTRDAAGRFAPPAAAPAPARDDGEWIPFDRLDASKLSGYTLPKLVDGQEYHASAYQMLADAKAAGFTQSQVDSYVRALARREGWAQ